MLKNFTFNYIMLTTNLNLFSICIFLIKINYRLISFRGYCADIKSKQKKIKLIINHFEIQKTNN